MSFKYLVLLLSALLAVFSAYGEEPRHAREVTVISFDNPLETKVSCLETADLGLLGKHCYEWKLQTKRHSIMLRMEAPISVSLQQIVAIKDSCLVAAGTVSLINLNAGIASFEACVAVSQLASDLVDVGAVFTVYHRSEWK